MDGSMDRRDNGRSMGLIALLVGLGRRVLERLAWATAMRYGQPEN